MSQTNSQATKNSQLRADLKAITMTLIFEASALNRDEKLGGNIPSIKKLTRFGNKTFSYLSRVAIRHYLFETLSRLYKDDWEPAECFESGTGDNKVVQFDLRTQNILTHAELDAFGYMFTIGGQQSITRKATVGITKAVALETWEGDMQFNANHDLASRCGANPNPVNKEEQESYFKVSFTIDIEKLGHDEWWIKGYNYDDSKEELSLVLSEKGMDVVLKDVEKKEEKSLYKIGEHEIKIDGLSCSVSKELMEEKTEKPKNQEEKNYITFKADFLAESEKEDKEKKQTDKKDKEKRKKFRIYEGEYDFNEEEGYYKFTIGGYNYDSDKKTLKLSLIISHTLKAEKEADNKYTVKIVKNNKEQKIGYVEIDAQKKVSFKLEETKKKERIKQIVNSIKDGLIYHSSGENYGIVPKFMIAAGLDLPVPIFHSFVEFGRFETSVLENNYIRKINDSEKLVYISNSCKHISFDTKQPIIENWDDFIEKLGLK